MKRNIFPVLPGCRRHFSPLDSGRIKGRNRKSARGFAVSQLRNLGRTCPGPPDSSWTGNHLLDEHLEGRSPRHAFSPLPQRFQKRREFFHAGIPGRILLLRFRETRRGGSWAYRCPEHRPRRRNRFEAIGRIQDRRPSPSSRRQNRHAGGFSPARKTCGNRQAPDRIRVRHSPSRSEDGSLRERFLRFPMVSQPGVYESGKGWNCHEYHRFSEFYSDFADYTVHITAPEGFVVGASGKLLAASADASRKRSPSPTANAGSTISPGRPAEISSRSKETSSVTGT